MLDPGRKTERSGLPVDYIRARTLLQMHTVGMLDSVPITCPFCGERFEALVDTSAGTAQYVEDCPVCCQPIEMSLHVDAHDGFDLQTDRG